ncbi:MAG: BamA/TamA family outer membrane protein [Candidatus Eisenbacteria sp.]|nr:BamA/TamA family outer membrane protein [Candidatus Eisenbacteria bacterium]
MMSTREILESVGIGPGDAVGRAETRGRLESLLVRYRDSGFPRARVVALWKLVREGRTELRLLIDEGAKYHVGSVTLSGCRGVSCPELESFLETRKGSLLRGSILEEDLDRLLDAYENQGYPYVNLQLGPRWSEAGAIDVRVAIDEGPRVVIDEIRIRGNRTTRKHVIERACGVAVGDVYSQRVIDRIEPRLLGLGLFDEVRTGVSLRDEAGSAVLDIRVGEAKTNSVYGAVGYIPREGKAGYLTGVLDVAFGNISGTGRSASARWRTYQPGAFEWTFTYGEPWLLGTPLKAGFSIYQDVQDSILTQTVGEISLEYPLGDQFWARVAGWSEGVTAGSGAGGLIRGSRRRTVDLGVRWDSRDDPLNPGRGHRTELGVAYGRKRYEGHTGDAVRSTIYQASENLFVPVARRRVLALRMAFWWLDSTEREIPDHEQLPVGGAESLRGYGEDEFSGWRVLTLGAEYRILLGRRSRVQVFVDAAHLDRRLRVSGGWVDREKRLFGYGFGLRSESRLGQIGVDFGLAGGEPLTEGKIHVRVESEF